MAPSRQGVGDPFTGVTDADTVLHVTELAGEAQASARGMVEAEDALRLVCEHFERTDDPEAQGELAVEALDHVERQLALTRHRRQGLDSIEGKLWARRNALERFLIHTRGRAWWRERRSLAQPGGPASEQT
ncbi:MAG TPA: hypothetical protein VGW98_04820 [Solirubrobacteraceae bacterium]|nr:hypothetical protein [Solirubrobacteraceae bacterium]